MQNSGLRNSFNGRCGAGKKRRRLLKKKSNETRLNIARVASFLAIPILVIAAIVVTIINIGFEALLPVLYTFFSLIGSITGGLLLGYEIDQYNPILQQICSNGGKKTNCGAILNGKASKIMGISWSSIGFTYFMGALLTLLFTGITNIYALATLAWLNLLATPYIFYSIYYQWKIARQWCTLCLCVQAILALQLITAMVAGWPFVPFNGMLQANILLPILLSYIISFIIVSLLLPAYRKAKESKRNKTELQRLKHNPQIFQALLARQKTITESPEGSGIKFGNSYATTKIIKICSPYCGPCAKAHVPLEELLHINDDLQVQILFTATNKENDFKAPPVRHLLAIAQKGNENLTERAMDDWYLAEKRLWNFCR